MSHDYSDEQQPPEPSEAYQKARRMCSLFSGLLVAWEIIGIELGEVPLSNFSVTLQSPDAAPVVLLALVGYFTIRLMIEWSQVHPQRKKVVAARIDLLLAFLLVGSAIGIYFFQIIYGEQIASLLSKFEMVVIMLGMAWGFNVYFFFTMPKVVPPDSDAFRVRPQMWLRAIMIPVGVLGWTLISPDLAPVRTLVLFTLSAIAWFLVHKLAFSILGWPFKTLLPEPRVLRP